MPEKDLYQVSLKLILENSQGEVLILKDLASGSFAGFYDLPGGRIDTNEFETDYLEIIKREIREEVGDIKFSIFSKPVSLGRARLKRLDINGQPIRVIYIFFKAEYKSGEIIISDEHTAYKWVKLKEVKLEDYFVSGILEGLKMYLN